MITCLVCSKGTLDSVIKKGEDMIQKSSELILPTGGALSTIAAASNQKVRRECHALADKLVALFFVSTYIGS